MPFSSSQLDRFSECQPPLPCHPYGVVATRVAQCGGRAMGMRVRVTARAV
jgi:hypothetical protein